MADRHHQPQMADILNPAPPIKGEVNEEPGTVIAAESVATDPSSSSASSSPPPSSPRPLAAAAPTLAKTYDSIKTHFPAARIKKLMQSDEDIGKVAQATPVVVGRALEIFMASLVLASCDEAKKGGQRRVTASHIRGAIEANEQYDFLVESVGKYPAPKN